MKILVIGDFHGKFPKKVENLVYSEKVDLAISLGDYAPFKYRDLWFKHCYGKDCELWEVIGKEKYKKLILDDMKSAENVLKKLNKLPVPVFTTLGNVDYPSSEDVGDFDEKKNKSMPNWDEKNMFVNILKRYSNIKRFDYSYFRFKNFVFIGMRGHSWPGDPSSKGYKKHKKILSDLFNKFKKENKENKVVFVSHIVPYNTKLDKIGMKAHKKVRGKHYGSKLTKSIIEKFKPILTLVGHQHENPGIDKLKNSIIVNPGAVPENRAAIIEMKEGSKPKIRLIK